MKTIADLNDELRRNAWTPGPKNKVVITSNLAADPKLAADAIAAVRVYDSFDEDNDPWEEHDYATLRVNGEMIFFKIDYYDNDMRYASADPTDPTQTIRVLTIGLASDY